MTDPVPQTATAWSDVVRVIVEDDANSGPWNMAVDEVLLESALSDGVCSLRWYRWREPTLSLGYFQSPDDPLIDEQFAGLARVRRLSGGGAILHDRELTYSCAIGSQHPLAAHPGELYRLMHATIVGVLENQDVHVAPRGASDRSLDANFLCFSRGDANDLVVDGHKVLGSAQRRRRGAVLQHGSLLLERSPVAPEYPGLLDLTGLVVDDAFCAALANATASVLGGRGERASLTPAEWLRACELTAELHLLQTYT